MKPSRRNFLAVLGGGVVIAAGTFAVAATRKPIAATRPWDLAGGYDDPRKRALSYALLAPNPHNRQPWMVDLSTEAEVTLFADTSRMLPETDPMNRQITIGLGAFLELLRMAAAEDGYQVGIASFPEGSDPAALDRRPIAHITFARDTTVSPDPLFPHVKARRSNKEPYDLARPLEAEALARAGAVVQSLRFGQSTDATDIAALRTLSHEALQIEIDTPRTYMESVNLFRIGRREIVANPDGIDFSGPLFESLHLLGQFTRASAADQTSQAYQAGLAAVFANTDTAMGHVWLVSNGNSRDDQLAAGADWVRLHLALTAEGIDTQPLSQALQEYPEMVDLYARIHQRLAPSGGTVQMFARVGHGPAVGQSPRWPLDAKIIHA